MDFKRIIILLTIVSIVIGTNVKKNNFKAIVNVLNEAVNDKFIVQTYDIILRSRLERYLEHICEFYNKNGIYMNKYIEIKKNTYSFIIYADRCKIEIREASIAENFKNLVSVFKNLITNKKIYKDNKVFKSLKPIIKKYLQDICFYTFKASLAGKKCHLKRTIYNFGGCLYILKCTEYDTNNLSHTYRIIDMVSITDVASLDYCNKHIGVDCNEKCFKESFCSYSEHNVSNICNAKYYYTCVKFNNRYLPEQHKCKNSLLFDGNKCV